MQSLVGKKFNRLTVIDEPVLYNKAGQKRRVVHCRCDCGNESFPDKYNMIKGRIKSCGCLKADIRHTLTGDRFGMLVVLERIIRKYRNGKNRYMVRCQCDCGNITETDVGSLYRGATTSCGCRRDWCEKLRGSNSSQFTGYRDISGHDWSQFKRRAKKRNLEFNISIQYAWELYEKQDGKCALTGIPLSFGGRYKRHTASLDRLDNEKGYVEGNLQWVHKSVNIMRNVYSVKHFIEVCLLVARQNGWQPANQSIPFCSPPNLSKAAAEELCFHSVRPG